MSRLVVRLFGRFSVERDARRIAALDSARARELFAYLLLHPQRGCHREVLVAALWPDTPPAQARKALRQALWQLQSALDEGDITPPRERPLLVQADWVAINPDAQIWVDKDAFEAAIARGQGIPAAELGPDVAAGLREAAGLYTGDLLATWPQEWCLYERERLLTAYLNLLDRLMSRCEASADYDQALGFGADILRYDHGRERTHRRMMRLHYLAGDRAEALRQFRRCVEALRAELDVAPSARTTALYRQILADQPGSADSSGGSGAGTVALLASLAVQLTALRAMLIEIEARLHAELEQHAQRGKPQP